VMEGPDKPAVAQLDVRTPPKAVTEKAMCSDRLAGRMPTQQRQIIDDPHIAAVDVNDLDSPLGAGIARARLGQRDDFDTL
jgi:hypothetical protein